MSYQKLPYTWGAKTLSEINDLTTQAAVGDTVWNTEWNLMEVRSVNGWTNDCAVWRKASNNHTGLDIGSVVEANDDTSILGAGADEERYCGVIIRTQFNTAIPVGKQFKAAVAYMGMFPVKLFSSTTQNGQAGWFVYLDASTGNGQCLVTPTNPGVDTIGVLAENVTIPENTSVLANVHLQTVEHN